MKRILTVLPLLFVFAACGAEGQKAIQDQIISKANEIPKILEGIKDKASWDAAKPALEKVVGAVSGLKDKLGKLPAVEGADKLKGELETGMSGVKDKVMAALGKMGNVDFLGQIKDVLKKLWPSIG